jgi:uncharacterized protein
MKTATITAALLFSLSAAHAAGPKAPPTVNADQIEKIKQAAPDKPVAQPQQARKILVFDKCEGFVHGSIPVANEAFKILGEKTGAFTVTISNDMAAFDEANLKQYDAILFNSTTQLKFANPAQREALMGFVKGGKGIIGIHAASDNFPTWPEAQEMMGGCFDGHPWTGGGTWAVKLDEPAHPLNKSFNGQGFKIHDEIYQVKGPYSRATLRVLLSLDLSDPVTGDVKGQKRADKDNGIAWIRPYGKGRVFYCSLGHNAEVYWNPAVLRHYLAGIQYALGDLKVDDKPIAK